MSCPYSELLGVRGQGVHSKRIAGFALNDILATIIAALITSYVFKVSILVSLVSWFIMGEVFHYIFGVDTAFLELIGVERCAAGGLKLERSL